MLATNLYFFFKFPLSCKWRMYNEIGPKQNPGYLFYVEFSFAFPSPLEARKKTVKYL